MKKRDSKKSSSDDPKQKKEEEPTLSEKEVDILCPLCLKKLRGSKPISQCHKCLHSVHFECLKDVYTNESLKCGGKWTCDLCKSST